MIGPSYGWMKGFDQPISCADALVSTLPSRTCQKNDPPSLLLAVSLLLLPSDLAWYGTSALTNTETMALEQTLTGKVAIVSGSARGIGAATCIELASR